MNIIIMGPQGCGKGTQADRITAAYGMKHFSTGDALREEIKSGSDLGKRIDDIINKRGQLVPAEIVNAIIEKAVHNYRKSGLIFDGYPRTLEQAEYLQGVAKIDAIISIEISDEEAVKRISSRYLCPQCSKGYNVITLPPKKSGLCDADGTKLVRRADDEPEKVLLRLTDYHNQTKPLIAFYERLGTRVHRIDGARPIETVFDDVAAALGKKA